MHVGAASMSYPTEHLFDVLTTVSNMCSIVKSNRCSDRVVPVRAGRGAREGDGGDPSVATAESGSRSLLWATRISSQIMVTAISEPGATRVTVEFSRPRPVHMPTSSRVEPRKIATAAMRTFSPSITRVCVSDPTTSVCAKPSANDSP
jgi:hypothetical protein